MFHVVTSVERARVRGLVAPVPPLLSFHHPSPSPRRRRRPPAATAAVPRPRFRRRGRSPLPPPTMRLATAPLLPSPRHPCAHPALPYTRHHACPPHPPAPPTLPAPACRRPLAETARRRCLDKTISTRQTRPRPSPCTARFSNAGTCPRTESNVASPAVVASTATPPARLLHWPAGNRAPSCRSASSSDSPYPPAKPVPSMRRCLSAPR
jgi:hypothetical protein